LPPAGKIALAAAAGGVVVLGVMALRSRTSSSNTPLVAPDGTVYHLPVKRVQFDENGQPGQQQPPPPAPPAPPATPVDPEHKLDRLGLGLLWPRDPGPGQPGYLGYSPTGVPIQSGTIVPSSTQPMVAPVGPPPRPTSAPAYVAATRTPSITTNTSPAPTTGTGGGYADQGMPATVARGAWHGKMQARWNGRGTGAGIGSGPKGGGMGRLGGGPTPAGVHPPTTWPSAGLITTAPGQVAPGTWRAFSVHRGSNH